jgi:hypothetical protein
MAMVCPQCSTTHEQRLQCPLCGARLLYDDARRRSGHEPPPRWRQQSWGRIFVGVVLAQGLFYGLRHLVTGVLMAIQDKEAVDQLWTTASGILLLQGVRFVCLLAGSVFAGVGQRHGALLGGVVGVWNGALSVFFLPGPAQSLTTIAVLGQPLFQAMIGAVGGWLGSAFWEPPSPVVVEATPPRKRAALRRPVNLFAGPVAWVRVAAGAFLAVAGTLSATIFFEKILDLSHGSLATTDDLQDRLITMEIKALALLLGGALAGSAVTNGFKQGLCVGLAATVVLIGVEIHFVERWIQAAALTIVAAVCLSAVGGWFGSQLFPPLVKSCRERGLGRLSL